MPVLEVLEIEKARGNAASLIEGFCEVPVPLFIEWTTIHFPKIKAQNLALYPQPTPTSIPNIVIFVKSKEVSLSPLKLERGISSSVIPPKFDLRTIEKLSPEPSALI